MIHVNTPCLSGNERKYLCECIDTEWISSEGPFVKRLESGVAALVGRQQGIAVCNGSVALDVAMAALRVGPGDEVVMPAFTIISCCASIVRAGATPVLVDADPATWNMDVEKIEEKISPRTKAILVAHIYGLPVNMGPVLALARKYGLLIIEDAAEAIGQTCRLGEAGSAEREIQPSAHDTHPCGSFGDISTMSFYPNKHITTGEGGMVLVDQEVLAERCRSLRNLCFDKERRFIHEELGWNFRMSNMQAAVGVAQLERIESSVRRKREIGAWYRELLADVPGLQLPLAETDYATNIYWVFGVVLDDSLPINAYEAMQRMRAKGVDCRHFFWPMHRQPALRGLGLFQEDANPVAERLAERGFYLPSGLALTRDQAEISAGVLREVLNEL